MSNKVKPAIWKNLEHACFSFAATANPTNAEALANLAVFHQCITQEYDKAERIYRRALFSNPNDSRLNENYSTFVKERHPGGTFAHGGPGLMARQRSTIVGTMVVNDETWHEMLDDEPRYFGCETFYWNRTTGETKWECPTD